MPKDTVHHQPVIQQIETLFQQLTQPIEKIFSTEDLAQYQVAPDLCTLSVIELFNKASVIREKYGDRAHPEEHAIVNLLSNLLFKQINAKLQLFFLRTTVENTEASKLLETLKSHWGLVINYYTAWLKNFDDPEYASTSTAYTGAASVMEALKNMFQTLETYVSKNTHPAQTAPDPSGKEEISDDNITFPISSETPTTSEVQAWKTMATHLLQHPDFSPTERIVFARDFLSLSESHKKYRDLLMPLNESGKRDKSLPKTHLALLTSQIQKFLGADTDTAYLHTMSVQMLTYVLSICQTWQNSLHTPQSSEYLSFEHLNELLKNLVTGLPKDHWMPVLKALYGICLLYSTETQRIHHLHLSPVRPSLYKKNATPQAQEAHIREFLYQSFVVGLTPRARAAAFLFFRKGLIRPGEKVLWSGETGKGLPNLPDRIRQILTQILLNISNITDLCEFFQELCNSPWQKQTLPLKVIVTSDHFVMAILSGVKNMDELIQLLDSHEKVFEFFVDRFLKQNYGVDGVRLLRFMLNGVDSSEITKFTTYLCDKDKNSPNKDIQWFVNHLTYHATIFSTCPTKRPLKNTALSLLWITLQEYENDIFYELERNNMLMHEADALFKTHLNAKTLKLITNTPENLPLQYDRRVHTILTCNHTIHTPKYPFPPPKNFETVLVQLMGGIVPSSASDVLKFLKEHVALIQTAQEAEEFFRIITLLDSEGAIMCTSQRDIIKLYQLGLNACKPFIKNTEDLTRVLKYLPESLQLDMLQTYQSQYICNKDALDLVLSVFLSEDIQLKSPKKDEKLWQHILQLQNTQKTLCDSGSQHLFHLFPGNSHAQNSGTSTMDFPHMTHS